MSKNETLWASCRPRLSSIAAMHELVSVLIEVSCSILYSDLKPTVLDVMHKHPVLRGKDNAEDKSQHIADKLMVLQKHLRQVAADLESIEQSGLPQYQKAALQKLFEKMKANNSDPADPVSSEVKNSKLQPTVSEVTTDSTGWPVIPDLKTQQNSEEELLLRAAGRRGAPPLHQEGDQRNIQEACSCKVHLEEAGSG